MQHYTEIIKKPLITEKAARQSDLSNRYSFAVSLGSNKNQIKLAIEKLYDVKVISVKTNITPGKKKRSGKFGKKKLTPVKKALVELEKGQKIEFFTNI